MRIVAVVVCLAVSVVCMTIYMREDTGGPLHGLQGAVSEMASPLSLAGAAVSSGTSAVGTSLEDMTVDENSLSSLKDYNAELLEQYTQMEEYRQEAERLQELLDLKESADVNGVGARVIGKSTNAWDQTITINKGTNDDVQTGLTVMSASGVIGQVVQVSGGTATVRLLTDPQSGAAAMIQSNREEGVVRGSLEGVLYLEDLDVNADVEVGDTVVTSGLGGSYRSGLIIGTVAKVDDQQGDATRRIVVTQNDTSVALEEVLVVYSEGEEDNSKSSEDDSNTSDNASEGESDESSEASGEEGDE